MRVIAGSHKGRKLKSVPGKQTRPTSDKVKEAVFHTIGPFFTGGKCLDLFAGSGSLGIEALSRGMEQAIFIDQYPKAVQTIKRNLQLLNIMKPDIKVKRMSADRALQFLAKRKCKFDLILIDPPYLKVDYESLLHTILQLNLLKENSIIYCEHQSIENLPSLKPQCDIIKQTSYGKTTRITLYRYLFS